jgi:hypothetical protein
MSDLRNEFSYSENSGVISFCGFEWEKSSKSNVHSSQYKFPLYEGSMKNKEIDGLVFANISLATTYKTCRLAVACFPGSQAGLLVVKG